MARSMNPVLLKSWRAKLMVRIALYGLIPLVLVISIFRTYQADIIAPARQRTDMQAQEVFRQAEKLSRETNYRAAVLKYLEILERNPGSPWLLMVYYRVGNIYLEHLGDIPKAKYAYENFLTHFPEHQLSKDVHRRLAYIEQVGDYGGEPYHRFYEAKLYAAREQYEMAIAKMHQTVELFPESTLNPEIYTTIIDIYENKLHNDEKGRLSRIEFSEKFFPLTPEQVVRPF